MISNRCIKHCSGSVASLLFFLLSVSVGNAQEKFDISGRETIDPVYKQVFESYEKVLGQGGAIFNGPEYTGGDPTVDGHQFFNSRNYEFGSVIYRGFKFDSLILNYDIFQDELVVVQSSEGEFRTITPDPELVSVFIISDHIFVRFQVKPEGLNSNGYFELLYNGDTRVLAKRRKTIGQSRAANYIYDYSESDRYYVYHDERYHSIGSKGAYLSLFPNEKKRLKSFAREKNLRFKDSPEFFLTHLSEYIDAGQQ